jgi:hypothetical protein
LIGVSREPERIFKKGGATLRKIAPARETKPAA